MKNLFPKITTKSGGYTTRVRFNDEARGERYFDTEYGVHAWQQPGSFVLTCVITHDGHHTECTAGSTIGKDLRVGDQITLMVQRWSMRGRAKQMGATIYVTGLETVVNADGFVLIRYSYEPPRQTEKEPVKSSHDAGTGSDSTTEDDVPDCSTTEQPQPATTSGTTTGDHEMNVTRSALIALFEALEFKTASKWNKARLLGKINGLPDVVDEDTDAGDNQELLDNLLDAVENETEITIEDDVAKKAPAKGKEKAAAKDKAKPAAKKAPAKPSVERDKFGSKIGTQCNLINEVMTGKPQETKAIAEASGMTVSRVKAHMTYLVGKSFVEKTDKGYKLDKDAPKKPAAKAKPKAKPAAKKKEETADAEE